jgi:hypothetical protein
MERPNVKVPKALRKTMNQGETVAEKKDRVLSSLMHGASEQGFIIFYLNLTCY